MTVQKLTQSRETSPKYRILHQLTQREKQAGSIFIKRKHNTEVTYKDLNGDGSISEDEVIRIRRFTKAAADENLSSVTERIDVDGDGKPDISTMAILEKGILKHTKSVKPDKNEDLYKEARVAWIDEIDFSENELP